jgi:hypothetical protein
LGRQASGNGSCNGTAAEKSDFDGTSRLHLTGGHGDDLLFRGGRMGSSKRCGTGNNQKY